jgi:hypothetical protein
VSEWCGFISFMYSPKYKGLDICASDKAVGMVVSSFFAGYKCMRNIDY